MANIEQDEVKQLIDDLRLDKARLGVELEAFLSSVVGSYLIERADLEVERLIRMLIGAKPSDLEANTTLRSRIEMMHSFQDWISEAIDEGRIALEDLRQQESLD